MRTFTFFSVFFFLITFNSCSNKTNPVDTIINKSYIECTVTDTAGSPLSNVDMHYMLLFDDVTEGSLTDTKPSTKINFLIPEPGYFDLVIFRIGSRDTVLILFSHQYLPAGNHDYPMELENLANGVYIYVLKGENNQIEGTFFINEPPTVLKGKKPLIKTSSNGMFFLNTSVLGIGSKSLFYNEGVNEPEIKVVSDRIWIILFKDGFQDLFVPLKVDPKSVMRLNLTMTAQ